MGFFKKIFKPVSKVLDKIIPNEVKPFLPYAAAFAPVFGPTASLFGKGIMQRALLSGGANVLGQLSQEGNEGDINLLSAGLGALTGAMTTPGAATQFRNMQVGRNPIMDFAGPRTGLQKATDFGLEALAKGSDIFAAGAADPFSMAGLKAAALPAATATGDLMFAQAKRDQDAYEDMMAAEDEERRAADANRALAIRRSMEAYGATEEEILEAIEAAGYKKGGRVGFDKGGAYMDVPYSLFVKAERAVENEEINPRTGDPYDNVDQYIEAYLKGYKEEDFKYKTGGRVGFRFGGIDKAIEGVGEEIQEEGKEGIMQASREDPLLVEEYNKYVFDLLENRPDAKPMSFQEFKRMIKSGMKSGGRVKMEKGGDIKEGIMLVADETGGEPDFGSKEYYEKEVADEIADLKSMMKEDKMYNLGPWHVGMIERLIVAANNKGVDILELTEIYEKAKNSSAEWFQSLPEDQQEFWKKHYQEDFDRTTNMGIFPGQFEFGFFEDKKDADKRDKKVPAPKADPFDPMRPPVQEAKDGGLMDLGGKEMDLRGGGFVPIGKKERADDVPARLSKNEFVMTADAVRAAGGGSVNEGAKRMYKVMNDLEARA